MTSTPTMTLATTSPAASDALASAAGGIGALVWWSLTNTMVTPDRMRAILASEGADPSIVPAIDPAAAIRRAAREWSQGKGKAARFRAEIASEGPAGVVVGILRREQVSAGEVRWVQVDTLGFDLPTLTWTMPGATPEAAAFRGVADEIRTHLDHQWIRPFVLIRGLTDASAVCLRDRGGVYYVPASKEPELARLARIVGQIGKCHLDIVHAQGTDASRQSIANGATAALTDDVGALLTRIGEWAERTGKVNSGSAATVLGELAELQQRAALYELSLGVTLEDLQNAIAGAKAEALRVINLGDDELAGKPSAAPTARVPGIRAPVAPVKVAADQTLLDGLRAALVEIAAAPRVKVFVTREVMERHALPIVPTDEMSSGQIYSFWRFKAGHTAAVALGYNAATKFHNGVPAGLMLVPLDTVPVPTETPAPPVADPASATPSPAPEAPAATDAPIAETPVATEAPPVATERTDEQADAAESERRAATRAALADLDRAAVIAIHDAHFGPGAAGKSSREALVRRLANDRAFAHKVIEITDTSAGGAAEPVSETDAFRATLQGLSDASLRARYEGAFGGPSTLDRAGMIERLVAALAVATGEAPAEPALVPATIERRRIALRIRNLDAKGNGAEWNRKVRRIDGGTGWASDLATNVEGSWSAQGIRAHERKCKQTGEYAVGTIVVDFESKYTAGARAKGAAIVTVGVVVSASESADKAIRWGLDCERNRDHVVVTAPDGTRVRID